MMNKAWKRVSIFRGRGLALGLTALLGVMLAPWAPSLAQRPDSMEHLINRYMDKGAPKSTDSATQRSRREKETTKNQAGDFNALISQSAGKGATLTLKAAKVDLASLMALHPDMALFSQARGQFLKPLALGTSTSAMESELARRNEQVTRNHEVWGKDLDRAAKELSALKRKAFNLRAVKSRDINLEGEKLQKALAGNPKIAMANVSARANDNPAQTDTEKLHDDEQAANLARQAYERALGEIEERFITETSRMEKLIQEKEEQVSALNEKIEAPLYESAEESAKIMARILQDIRQVVDRVAGSKGIAMVVNDSFGPFKYSEKGITMTPDERSSFTSKVYPTSAANHYIQVLSRMDLARDPNVKNIRNMEESLISTIRDHLFDHSTSRRFYAPFHNSTFVFGDIPDLTLEVLTEILREKGVSEEKCGQVLNAWTTYTKGLEEGSSQGSGK